MCPAILAPPRCRAPNGSVRSAITSKRPTKKARRSRRVSARADCQQDFFPEGVFELLEVQGRLTFVAQHLEHRWPTFLGHFDASILEMDDVHLQRLDLEVPVIAAMWTGQRHRRYPFRPFGPKQIKLILCNGWSHAQRKTARKARIVATPA